MTTTQTWTDLEAFVWLGFHLDTSLTFRVTLPTHRDDCRRLIETVGCYNQFQPENVWEIIDGWREALMHVDLAREGSVALYFRFPWTERQTLSNREAADNLPYTWNQTPVPADKCVDWAARLTSELLEENADEISYDRETRTLRVWWD